uniref:PTB domain-containing protein n=1 Tax=Salvator merianae TaxID=96440 RepID=A0A8D0DYJ7_SALMN
MLFSIPDYFLHSFCVIADQRKQYTESALKNQHELQHRVEHLLTGNVDGKEISNVEDCIKCLKMMDAQDQVWGQDMLLQVKNHKLLLTDIESQELDSYPLERIQECSYVLDSGIYNSILAITVKQMNPPRISIMLFQCEEIGVSNPRLSNWKIRSREPLKAGKRKTKKESR